MSNYHILTGDQNGNSFRVVFHVAVPNANNRATVNYQTAIINSGMGGTTVMVEGNGAGQIATAEKAQIASGALFEYVEDFATNPGENAATLRGRVDARYTALVAALPGQIQSRLSYFGYSRDVP